MGRIRTIKPEFFRHEVLQELERKHPELHPMLLFAGLFSVCDKQGVFEWRPRMLALDILPFLWEGSIGEAMGTALVLLREAGLISQLLHGEAEYGFIPTFTDHQRMGGKEAQEPSKFPQVSEMVEISKAGATGKQRGSNGEAIETAPVLPGEAIEIAGREGEGIGREREITTVVGGGSSRDSRAGAEEPPSPPAASPSAIEEEVSRLRDLHLATCGLSTVPPVAMIREVLARGKPVALIDDIYQAHGGDVPRYRQRNIVEDLKRLRDGEQARASPGLGNGGRKSTAELRQEAIYRESRAFALGIVRES